MTLFSLPTYKKIDLKPLASVPELSQIPNFDQLRIIYDRDFVPFCETKRTLLQEKLERRNVTDYNVDQGREDFIRSLVREQDLLTLERIFTTFQEFKSHHPEPDFKLKILEIGAGRSYSVNPEHVSAPWLARWLSSRFSELEVTVSDIADYCWDLELEKKEFNLAGALHLDYCQLNPKNIGYCHFVFGRHLNQLFPDYAEPHNMGLSNEDLEKIASEFQIINIDLSLQGTEREISPEQEIEDLLIGVYKSLKIGGRALIDYDGGPVFDLQAQTLSRIDRSEIIVLNHENRIILPETLNTEPRIIYSEVSLKNSSF